MAFVRQCAKFCRINTLQAEKSVTLAHFGQHLARMRGARNLTKESLARATGLNVATVIRAEKAAECTLRTGTIMLILQAFGHATPPLTAKEAAFLAEHSGMDKAAALRYVPEHEADEDSVAVDSIVEELRTLVGETNFRALLESTLRCIRAAPTLAPPLMRPRARSLIVKRPPVQREGYVEEVHVEYEPVEPPASKPHRKSAGF